MTDVALPIALYLGTLVLLAFALRRSPLLTEETLARSSPLDALRGILATAVVCLHFVLTYHLKAEGQWREPDSDLLYNMGVVPVSLFFMITGYLFFGKVYRRTPDWGELLRSRVLRVMPLYLCVVAVVVLFTLIRTHFVIADGQRFMLELLSWELFSGFTLNGLEESGWMTAGAHWTLRYEALFYLALPIIAALFNRRGFGLPLLVSALLVGGLVAGLLFGSLLYLALRGLRRAMQGAPLAWRLGLGQLLRHPLAAVGQTLAFGLILLAMSLVVLLRGELLERWQAQLPAEAPNHFALNVLPDERQAFATAVAGLSPHASPLYPIVQGRLVSVKGHPAQEGLEDDSRGGRATRRDLNLTWSAGLPDGNRLEAGQWWEALPASDLPGVSLESELARSLGVGLGDTLGFVIGDRQIEARVTSLRQVSWDNFQPNFFVIFAPGALQDVPFTYLGSFYLPPGHDRELLALARQFPAVTLLPIDALLDQLRSILRQVSVAVEFVLLFVLAAGIAVLLAGLQATLDERIRQGALLRALGARRELLQRARRTEFILLGGASGLLAALGCEIVSALLYRLAFDLAWQPHPWLLLLPVLGALLVGTAGLLGTRRALTASPLLILRES